MFVAATGFLMTVVAAFLIFDGIRTVFIKGPDGKLALDENGDAIQRTKRGVWFYRGIAMLALGNLLMLVGIFIGI